MQKKTVGEKPCTDFSRIVKFFPFDPIHAPIKIRDVGEGGWGRDQGEAGDCPFSD